MNTMLVLRLLVSHLRRDRRGAAFVENMVLTAMAVTAVAAGAKTLGDAMKQGTDAQKPNIQAGFIAK
ncbi:MAG: hypothetical protein KF819_29715 [Labilithrix sp.]|nr:hypothetical protein [Labilithrix sp.]